MWLEKKPPMGLRFFGSFLVFVFLGGMFFQIYAQKRASLESPWKGREVFREKGCSQCHSVYGSNGKGGPDLGRKKFYGTYLQLATLMWNHFPGMSRRIQKSGYKFARFNEKEMSQLISYLAYIRYLGEPGDELKGKKLLKSKGCIQCHRFGGVGGDIGPDISAIKDYMSPIRLVESMWNHGPNLMELFQEYNIKRPEFKGNEIVNLAVAIRSYMSPVRVPVGSFTLGDPAKGKKLAEEKGCMNCHAFQGIGGRQGPDFTEIDLNYSVTQIAGQMWNHGPKMWEAMKSQGLDFPIFQEGEMADVIAYIYGLKLWDAPGNAQKGFQVVQEKKCLSCHSLNGKGSEIAIDLATIGEMDSPLGMITAMWNHAPAMQEKLLEKKMKWPRFNKIEMANLYAYLCSLNRSPAALK